MVIMEKDGQFIDDSPAPTEMGRAIEWGWIQTGATRDIGVVVNIVGGKEAVIETLKKDAEFTLPPDTRYELRQMVPHNYGRTNGMAWYHVGTFADRPTWEDESGFDADLGCFIVGRFTTPSLSGQPLDRSTVSRKIGDG